MKNFMGKKSLRGNQGLTLVEILIVIAIISIISSFFIINLGQKSMQEEIAEETEILLADLRYVRNLAVSRTTYIFDPEDGAQYPTYGYRIAFDRVGNKARYRIFADFGSEDHEKVLIKTRSIDNSAIELNDFVESKSSFYINFITENQVESNMENDANGKYLLELINRGTGYPAKGYRSVITLGERSLNSQGEVEYIWANFGVYYEQYSPPRPPTPPEDPPQFYML